ncbi:retinol dehydrogenase B [Cochliomyia hominivorax]
MSQYWCGKVAVITGASAGIGAKIAVKLANAGVIIIGLARRIDMIENLNKEIKGDGKIDFHACDLKDESNILKAFNWIQKTYGTINILICSAGIIKANFLTESSSTDLKELYDLNVYATTICLKEGLKLMRNKEANGRGHIIVMNSILGHRIPDVPVPLFSVYPATKHAITGLCQTLRQEIHFLKLNIKLTSINPGLVDTDFLKVYKDSVNVLPKLNPEDVAEAVYYALETPKHVQVEDITLQAMTCYDLEQVVN